MRVITKEVTVYNVDDLNLDINKDIRARVLTRYFEWNLADEWFVYQQDEIEESLEKEGFFNIRSGFSGFYSQGDGAYIEGSICYETACKLLGYDIPDDVDDFENIKIYQSGRYNHENTLYILGEKDDVSLGILEYLKDKSKELYKRLEEEYEYLTSEEGILESLQDYEFNASGEIFDM